MCDPVTASLVIASTAVSAFGSIYTGKANQNEANYAAQVAGNNAALSRSEAADAADRGTRENMRHGRQVAATRSAQIAAMAANGLDTSFGSAADVATDTSVLGMEDAQIIAENSARETRGFMINAQNYDQEAMAQRRQGKNAMISAGLDATSTILSGASQIKGMQRPSGKVSGFGKSGWGGSSAPNSTFKW